MGSQKNGSPKNPKKKINWKQLVNGVISFCEGFSTPCLGEGETREEGKARLGKETKNISGLSLLLTKKLSTFNLTKTMLSINF